MQRFLYSSKGIIRLLLGLGVMILGGGYVSSLWFLRGVWDVPSPELEFGYQRTAFTKHFFAHEGQALEASIYEKVRLPQDDIYRISYSKTLSGEYLSLIPRLRSQINTTKALRVSGWEPKRIGWIVFATRGETRIPSMWQAMKQQARMAIAERIPVSPLFFFRAQTTNRSSVAAYASSVNEKIHGSISVDSFDFTKGSNRIEISKDFNKDKGLIVSLPSNVLESLTAEFKASIEGKLAQAFHFEKTTPAILSALPSGENVHLIWDADGVAVGVSKQGAMFGNAIINLMNKEQGQRHPRKKSFTLPDRSIGYEYVPGAADVRFTPLESDTHCLPSEGYEEVLFLCGKQEAAVLASSGDRGAELLQFMNNGLGREFGGYITGEYLTYFRGSEKNIEYIIQNH